MLIHFTSYSRKLAELKRKRDEEDKLLSRKIEEARKKDGYEAANETYQTENIAFNRIEEEIAILKTRYLTDKADKKSLPTPSRNEEDGFWESNRCIEPGSHLTRKGITELRRLLREESKAFREAVIFWVSIIFGAVGLAIGLISVLKS